MVTTRELENIEYAVIGPTDDRFRIPARRSRPSSLLFPMNTICLVERLLPNGRVRAATGTLIAPQVVLTAKHVLMRLRPGASSPCRPSLRPSQGVLYSRIRVSLGADLAAADAALQRPATPPFIVADSSRIRVHPTLDYGVIILPTPFRSPRQFMMLQPRGASGTATLLTIAGYPCDKEYGTMWGHSARLPRTGVGPTHLRYTIDTCPGHSGSPVWLLGNAGIRLLLGVHTGGVPGVPGCDNDPRGTRCLRPRPGQPPVPVTPVTGENCGVRVTCDVINTIMRWCRAFGVRTLPRIDQAAFRRACPSR